MSKDILFLPSVIWQRWLPVLFGFSLWLMIALVWPSEDGFVPVVLQWFNVVLLSGISIVVFTYAFRGFFSPYEERAGSYLRTKLVTAMVLMVLVPSVVLQITANQVIEKGMDVWFDVRVDTLLDKAMNLAQGFYARVEADMAASLEQVNADNEALIEAASLPLGSMGLSRYLNTMLKQYQWTRLELLDADARVMAAAQRAFQGQSWDSFKTQPLSEMGKSSIVLGHFTLEHQVRDDGEYVMGYLPLYTHRNFVALLRAETRLPDDVMFSARSIETD
ncbi:MAG: PAS domain-containing sensor histidine kinase, partial [Mariprofundaceae bacterium]|nr:PAS domain-containing sensor histidine kinase [Mariprofundaceae bacterium]